MVLTRRGTTTPGGAGDPGCLRRGPRKPVLGTTEQRQRENSWDELGLRRHHAAHAHPPPSGPARRAGRVAPPNFTDGEAEVRKGRHLPQLAEPVGPEPRSEPGRPCSWARTQRCLRRGASRGGMGGAPEGWEAGRRGGRDPGLAPAQPALSLSLAGCVGPGGSGLPRGLAGGLPREGHGDRAPVPTLPLACAVPDGAASLLLLELLLPKVGPTPPALRPIRAVMRRG